MLAGEQWCGGGGGELWPERTRKREARGRAPEDAGAHRGRDEMVDDARRGLERQCRVESTVAMLGEESRDSAPSGRPCKREGPEGGRGGSGESSEHLGGVWG